jgi:integrase
MCGRSCSLPCRDEASEGSWPEVQTLRRDDFEGEVWVIPAPRMKNKLDHAVPLTAAILALVGEKPKKTDAPPYIFSTTGGKRPFSGFSKAKAALDERIAKLRKEDGREPMPRWTQHDLRRTAKTLMGARACGRTFLSGFCRIRFRASQAFMIATATSLRSAMRSTSSRR